MLGTVLLIILILLLIGALPRWGYSTGWGLPACLFSRVGFGSVTACFARDHKSEVSRCGAFERHRRATVGLHFTKIATMSWPIRRPRG
jgi:Protein of unknown function (DUF3309)